MSVLLEQFSFEGRQEQAATAHNPAIAVTAGAGSGKTLTLVGRYLNLIERGYPLRSIVAITFTEKAAREMRTRIRKALGYSAMGITSQFFSDQAHAVMSLVEQVEAARISTIHSLCAEILRAHPAEANLDPNFGVLEEGLAAAYQAQAVDSALVWAANESETAVLFAVFKERDLRQILSLLMYQRPDFSFPLDSVNLLDYWGKGVKSYCDQWLDCPEWIDAMETLGAIKSDDAQDKLEQARREVLAFGESIELARGCHGWNDLLAGLAGLRKAISTGGRKTNWSGPDIEAARQGMRTLRQIYDDHWKSLAEKSSWSFDERLANLLPYLQQIYGRAQQEYQKLKGNQQALDFDDLEHAAAQLLTTRPEVLARWQRETRAVLVDEFQDTNERQRQIVYALAGFKANSGSGPVSDLFVVGDAKQSIYKFRGADVTIFRQVQEDIRSAGGLSIDLDLTFRAHAPILQGLNDLLSPVMEPAEGQECPYLVPFAPLHAFRQEPEKAKPPYIEFQIGLGENADSGRISCSEALAQRLHEIHEQEGFDWGDIALLFRSSTAFAVYETALEAAGVPFVTIAGRGFYDRPEIRDLLNALTAIADPSDDLALTGLLRSPALGLSDADLYRLRFSGQDLSERPLWEALKASTEVRAARAYTFISQLHDLSGRISVAAVLKRFLVLTNYHTILSAVSGGARMRRNIDKLLADAHRSRMVSLGDFLVYVQTLRDVGLREGEAPVDAGGAVQLMTVHKAKGLEFPVVVIADAAYEHRGGSEKIISDSRRGLLIDLRDPENDMHSVSWTLAALEESEKEDAEDRRLLYVACTRAKEKLIVNGHASLRKAGNLSLRGWLRRFGEVIGLEDVNLEEGRVTPVFVDLDLVDNHGAIACTLYPSAALENSNWPANPELNPVSLNVYKGPVPDLVAPLQFEPSEIRDEKIRDRETDSPHRVWQVVSKARRPVGPAWVVGKLVHEALHHWVFPDDRFEAFIRPFALEAGLTNPVEINATIREARRILDRFREHSLFSQLENARRFHEVQYTTSEGFGIIDLLYQLEERWTIADFKTDEVHSETEAWQVIRNRRYDEQLKRYERAFVQQTGQIPQTELVFLCFNNRVKIFEIK